MTNKCANKGQQHWILVQDNVSTIQPANKLDLFHSLQACMHCHAPIHSCDRRFPCKINRRKNMQECNILEVCWNYSRQISYIYNNSPYLTWQMSPTTISPTGIWMTSPPLRVANLCSCSILLCRPRNWRSLRQSLNAVTNTTTMTATKIAKPSIHPASFSLSSWPPDTHNHYNTYNTSTDPQTATHCCCCCCRRCGMLTRYS